MANTEIPDDRLQKQLEKIQQFRPIDDTFFEVLADDIPFCQEMLRVVLEDKNLVVKSVAMQKSTRNLVGRSVRLDALCVLSDGTLANIEVQRANNDNHFKRVRYNASCITASETEPGEKFENVPTVIMVYISEFDLLKGGKTAYHVEKVVKETGEIIDDGLKEIFINTEVDDGTDLGELLQLFNQTEVDNPKFPAFSKRMGYLKYDKGGKQKMCTIMEEYAKEYAEEYAAERVDEAINEKIKNALKNGFDKQIIMQIFNVDITLIMELERKMGENR